MCRPKGSLRGRRLKGKGKAVLGASETRGARVVSRPNSLPLPLPFRTPATQTTPKGVVFAPLWSANDYRFSRKLRECINAFVVSVPNDSERKSNIRIGNGFLEMFLFEL